MTSKLDIETEITVYAQVGDFNGFKEANSVSNIQELITFIEGKGKIRMRKVADGSGTSYYAGVKSLGKGNTIKQAVDVEAPVSAAFFEAGRIVADHLTVRNRFVFNGSTASLMVGDKEVAIPPIDYEVDLFERFDGREAPLVKIDIEIGKIREALRSMGEPDDVGNIVVKVSHLPFKPKNAFISSDDNTPEQQRLIKSLWEEYRQNPYGGPVKEITSSIDDPTQSVKPPAGDPQTPEGTNNGEAHV